MSHPSRRSAPPPARWVAEVAPEIAGVGLLAVVLLAVSGESVRALQAPGGELTFAGDLTALVGTYLLLVMILLIGRIPLLERTIGQDRLVRWHRQLGPWPICLLSLHAVLITAGYAAADRTGVLHEFWLLVTTYPDVLAAVVALGLLIMAGVASFRAARRRMRYETWWAVHLYTYLAVALAFAHQLANGASFVGHPVTRVFWAGLWAATAGTVVICRVGLPAWQTVRHQLRVVEVREEGPGVVSVICSGRRLDRLAVSGGQFFQWRFLVRGLWWQAHPYSLSALPRPPYLRVTVKGLGDQSHAMARIPKGTRVAIEGPYGTFTEHARRRGRVLLVAAGVGITPIRALLEDLPDQVDVVVILRASRSQDLILRDEIAAMLRDRSKGILHEVVGPRDQVDLDAGTLRGLVPDIRHRDLYVCGPEGFTERVVVVARRLSVPEDRIHVEEFAF
jgi:ferredoxin-NADP reductase/DMSO/TMAO reductase YedYZ heme-binding membrane subunit